MNAVLWVVVGLLAIAVIAWAVWSAARRSDAQLTAVRQEMQNSLATQGQAVNTQINHLMQSVTTQLGQVRQELQTGVASSGKLASDAQIAMAQQLQSSNEAIRKISMQLAEVQLAGQEMSKSTQTLQNVLGGAKTRGILGEVVLERLLQDALAAQRVRDAASLRFDRRNRGRDRAQRRPAFFAWIRNFRWMPIGGSWTRARLRDANFPRPSANMQIPSPRNTFCRTSTPSIMR